LFPVCRSATPRDIAIRCEQFSGEVLRERDLQASLPLMKTSLFLSTALGALLVTGVAAAAETPITYVLDTTITDGVLSGENELPTPVNATDTGTVRLTYYPDTKKLCGKISFTPAGFEYTLAHIHEGSETTANGGPYVILAGDKGAGEISVNTDLTAEQITKLTGGESYVNVHSAAHPDGAMRNQLVKDDTATPEPCEGGDEADAGASSSGASSSGAATSSSGSSGSDSGTSSSSSGSTGVTPDSTDDGGCNTSGSHGADAAALLALGAIVTAAARKRRNKKA
jgi:hypothetical protein